jgi:hypothetical protein
VLEAERLTKAGQADPFVDSSVREVDVTGRDPEDQVGESMLVEQGSSGSPGDWLQTSVGNLAYPDGFRMRKILHQPRVDPNKPAKPGELFPPTVADE